MRKKMAMALFVLLAVFLVACGNKEKTNTNTNTNPDTNTDTNTMTEPNQNHNDVNNLTEGPNLPTGLKAATNPKYPVGTKVVLKAKHKPGMEGAEATVVAAYDTTAYAVTYKPASGQPEVKNHKWVIHEELKDVNKKPYAVGEEVVIETDHLEGMKGATAKIEEAKPTTVYMVDYKSTTGEEVKNHRWVTEDEISAK
ncbi:YdhK family protein [Solibacillus sp. CAU 1738]|uniref:YdhK family protein n=1 Tax=Solibacillus sp. CAU 1738 TaxID=3140363 RepID=UPI0032613870